MNTPTRGHGHSERKWIGLARVTPKRGNDALRGAKGAYVSAVALADNVTDFSQVVTSTLNKHGFDVVEIEDIEEFAERAGKFSIASDVANLAERLSAQNSVALGTFHSYQ